MALTDNLVAYWKLDEASGNRSDAHNSYTLTNNNSVGSTTGKINSAATFGYPKYLSNTHDDLAMGQYGSFTGQVWVKLNSNTNGTILARWEGNAGDSEFQLFYESSVQKAYFWVQDSFVSTSYYVESTATLSTGVWYCIHFWYDASGGYVGLSINDGTPDTTVNGDGVWQNSGNTFKIGGGYYGYLDAAIDEVGLWSRYLSSGERTSLYNGGSGIAYPFTGGSDAAVYQGRSGMVARSKSVKIESESAVNAGRARIVANARECFVQTGTPAIVVGGRARIVLLAKSSPVSNGTPSTGRARITVGARAPTVSSGTGAYVGSGRARIVAGARECTPLIGGSVVQNPGRISIRARDAVRRFVHRGTIVLRASAAKVQVGTSVPMGRSRVSISARSAATSTTWNATPRQGRATLVARGRSCAPIAGVSVSVAESRGGVVLRSRAAKVSAATSVPLEWCRLSLASRSCSPSGSAVARSGKLSLVIRSRAAKVSTGTSPVWEVGRILLAARGSSVMTGSTVRLDRARIVLLGARSEVTTTKVVELARRTGSIVIRASSRSTVSGPYRAIKGQVRTVR